MHIVIHKHMHAHTNTHTHTHNAHLHARTLTGLQHSVADSTNRMVNLVQMICMVGIDFITAS